MCVCVCVFVARLFKLDVYGLVPEANGNRRELSGRASVSWPDDSPNSQLSTILQPNIFYNLAQFFPLPVRKYYVPQTIAKIFTMFHLSIEGPDGDPLTIEIEELTQRKPQATNPQIDSITVS